MIPNGTFWMAEVPIHGSLHGRGELEGGPGSGPDAQAHRSFVMISRIYKNWSVNPVQHVMALVLLFALDQFPLDFLHRFRCR